MPANELADLIRSGGRQQALAAAQEQDNAQTRRARSLRRPGVGAGRAAACRPCNYLRSGRFAAAVFFLAGSFGRDFPNEPA